MNDIEANRRANGQFGTTEHPEVAGVDLLVNTPDADEVRAKFETLWSCGPGEYVMGEYPHPETGEAMPAPIGQMCASNVHTHAYWDGTCQFAYEAAVAAFGPPAPKTTTPTESPWDLYDAEPPF